MDDIRSDEERSVDSDDGRDLDGFIENDLSDMEDDDDSHIASTLRAIRSTPAAPTHTKGLSRLAQVIQNLEDAAVRGYRKGKAQSDPTP